METETIDRLFLELSQVTQATTARELTMMTEVNALRAAVAAAVPAMCDYARMNPIWHDKETPQDPNNVHGWLREFGASVPKGA